MKNSIKLYWVNTHNLKNIDVEIPKNKITVITWVSWSWKSSLAFDTIYKEWQYRYIESLSSYLRQFFNLWTRPEIQHSEGLSPAIAIEQNKRVWNVRSTVWTLTETDDYLRLLFAKLGEIYCYSCGRKIEAKSVDTIIEEFKNKFLWKKILIFQKSKKFSKENDFLKWVRKNRKEVDRGKWFVRYLVKLNWKDDFVEYFYLEDPNLSKDDYPVEVYPIYDKVTLKEERLSRLKEDVIKILSQDNRFGILVLDDSKYKWPIFYTDKNFCPQCNIKYPDFTPQHFSPNRQEWACPTCHWLGKTLQVDWEKIIDPNSPYKDAIIPWRDSAFWQAILDKLAQKYWIDDNILWKDLPDRFKEVVIEGDWELLRVNVGWKYYSLYYKWVEDILIQQYQKWVLTVDFQAMLQERPCPDCKWKRLKKEALSVFILLDWWRKYNISDLQNLEIKKLIKILKEYRDFILKSKFLLKDLVERIIEPLLDRLTIINDLWLWYLTLGRQIDTLSWWEIQRLRLAKQLWNKLTGVIYVLDEPTIGLDENEIKKVIKAIKKLRDLWNTIVVVEHNEDFIKIADWIIEIWPWAWDFGWKLIFQGSYNDFLKADVLTAKYIRGDLKIEDDEHIKSFYLKRKENKDLQNVKYIEIKKAHKFNLKNIDVKIPLWQFTIITWPSGAGKTTLMYHILYRFLSEKDKYIQSFIRLNLLKQWYSWQEIVNQVTIKPDEWEHWKNIALQKFFEELEVETIRGYENVKNVLYVDQSSIGKTPRSCPATFIWVFDEIRKLFAWTSEAKMFGFTPWHFSFNSSKWACPECQWYWYKKVELQFLPDTYVPCPLCKWKRYKPEILQIKWHWKDISQVLDMYVEDAYEFFEDIPTIAEKLKLMVDIGLWYLKMWQPAHTLSGGESQRIKLVKHLLKSYKWHTIYFLDEPTVGLHFEDIKKLLKVLIRFLDRGDTILMIEHDRNLLKFADNVIKLKDWRIVNM